MTLFRTMLILILTGIVSYTGIVIWNHGIGLLPIFFGDILKMNWQGQFNLDFMFMLTLSAISTAWRYRFSLKGYILGCLAFFGDSLFLSSYLLVLIWQTKGDMNRMLLGEWRTDLQDTETEFLK